MLVIFFLVNIPEANPRKHVLFNHTKGCMSFLAVGEAGDEVVNIAGGGVVVEHLHSPMMVIENPQYDSEVREVRQQSRLDEYFGRSGAYLIEEIEEIETFSADSLVYDDSTSESGGRRQLVETESYLDSSESYTSTDSYSSELYESTA